MNNRSKLRHHSRLYLKQQRWGYLFILPWFAGVLVFLAWPLLQSFYFSLCTVKITGSGRFYEWVGLQNYIYIWAKDIYYLRRLLNFIINTALQLPIILVFSMMIALLLNIRLPGRGFFRTIFFLPVIIVSGPLISELTAQGVTTIPLVSEYGIYQSITGILPLWIADPITMLFSQLIMILWYSGIQILIFIAGLHKIDNSMNEAAKIDGATGWEIFWKITLPQLRPMILINGIYTLVFLANSEQNDIIYLISNNMLNPSSGYGYASAMAWMHTVTVIILLLLVWLWCRERQPQSHIKKSVR